MKELKERLNLRNDVYMHKHHEVENGIMCYFSDLSGNETAIVLCLEDFFAYKSFERAEFDVLTFNI